MKTFLPYLLFITILYSGTFAQNKDTVWTKIFGGQQVIPTPKGDAGNFMVHTKDNGYAIVGYTYSFGSGDQDIWVLRTNSSGDTLWSKTYGGQYSDNGYSISNTSDGGFIISGSTFSYGAGNGDYWLLKIDSLGDTLWTRTFGGINYDICYSSKQTFDGGYILLGYTQSFGTGNWDIWVIKTDFSGDSIWSNLYGGNGSATAYSIQQTPDSGYIIAGVTNSSGSLLRTNSKGDTLWSKTYQGFVALYSVDQTIDEGYVATGCKDGKIGLLNVNYIGKENWTKSFNIPGQGEGRCVLETNDGGFIVAGNVSSINRDIAIIKTNSSGDSVWNNSYGGTNDDEVGNIIQNTDSSFTFVGSTNSFNAKGTDLWIVKIKRNIPASIISKKPFPGISLLTNSKSFYQSTFYYNLLGQKISNIISVGNLNSPANSYYVHCPVGLMRPYKLLYLK